MLNMSQLTPKSAVSILQFSGRCLVHLAFSSPSLFFCQSTCITQKAHINEFMLSKLTCTMYNGIDTGAGHSLTLMIQLQKNTQKKAPKESQKKQQREDNYRSKTSKEPYQIKVSSLDSHRQPQLKLKLILLDFPP